MKTKSIIYIVIIFLPLLLIVGASCAASSVGMYNSDNYINPTEPITSSNIPDDDFRQLITEGYGFITLGDCENLKILSGIGNVNRNIHSIIGIRYFLSLEELYMMDNSIDNIPEGIHYLTSLKVIDFSGNDLTTDDLLLLQGYFPDATIDIY